MMVLVLSCKKDLKENEKGWNPYVKNEVLIFESSEKQLDTIVIDTIIDNAVSSSPEPELYRHTNLMIYRKLKLEENKFSNTEILSISSSTPEKLAEIAFSLRFDNAIFAGWGIKLEDLEKYPTMSITTKAGTFDDVIKIESVKHRPERENSVLYMYWSKKDGYIKFERADGFTWELIKKYVP
jgi:hypothetical protein